LYEDLAELYLHESEPIQAAEVYERDLVQLVKAADVYFSVNEVVLAVSCVVSKMWNDAFKAMDGYVLARALSVTDRVHIIRDLNLWSDRLQAFESSVPTGDADILRTIQSLQRNVRLLKVLHRLHTRSSMDEIQAVLSEAKSVRDYGVGYLACLVSFEQSDRQYSQIDADHAATRTEFLIENTKMCEDMMPWVLELKVIVNDVLDAMLRFRSARVGPGDVFTKVSQIEAVFGVTQHQFIPTKRVTSRHRFNSLNATMLFRNKAPDAVGRVECEADEVHTAIRGTLCDLLYDTSHDLGKSVRVSVESVSCLSHHLAGFCQNNKCDRYHDVDSHFKETCFKLVAHQVDVTVRLRSTAKGEMIRTMDKAKRAWLEKAATFFQRWQSVLPTNTAPLMVLAQNWNENQSESLRLLLENVWAKDRFFAPSELAKICTALRVSVILPRISKNHEEFETRWNRIGSNLFGADNETFKSLYRVIFHNNYLSALAGGLQLLKRITSTETDFKDLERVVTTESMADALMSLVELVASIHLVKTASDIILPKSWCEYLANRFGNLNKFLFRKTWTPNRLLLDKTLNQLRTAALKHLPIYHCRSFLLRLATLDVFLNQENPTIYDGAPRDMNSFSAKLFDFGFPQIFKPKSFFDAVRRVTELGGDCLVFIKNTTSKETAKVRSASGVSKYVASVTTKEVLNGLKTLQPVGVKKLNPEAKEFVPEQSEDDSNDVVDEDAAEDDEDKGADDLADEVEIKLDAKVAKYSTPDEAVSGICRWYRRLKSSTRSKTDRFFAEALVAVRKWPLLEGLQLKAAIELKKRELDEAAEVVRQQLKEEAKSTAQFNLEDFKSNDRWDSKISGCEGSSIAVSDAEQDLITLDDDLVSVDQSLASIVDIAISSESKAEKEVLSDADGDSDGGLGSDLDSMWQWNDKLRQRMYKLVFLTAGVEEVASLTRSLEKISPLCSYNYDDESQMDQAEAAM
jgi:hypothetical protein